MARRRPIGDPIGLQRSSGSSAAWAGPPPGLLLASLLMYLHRAIMHDTLAGDVVGGEGVKGRRGSLAMRASLLT